MQPQECLVSSARYSFWAHGYTAGQTRHGFCPVCSENGGGKRAKATVFLTVALTKRNQRGSDLSGAIAANARHVIESGSLVQTDTGENGIEYCGCDNQIPCVHDHVR